MACHSVLWQIKWILNPICLRRNLLEVRSVSPIVFFHGTINHCLFAELNLDYILDNPWIVVPVSATLHQNVETVIRWLINQA